MKVSKTTENIASLKTLILQLQLSLELSQINEILSAYSDLLLFLAEYSFVLENVSPETQPLKTTHVPVESSLSTQDPARDGSNWYGYVGQNPVVYVDPIGLFYYTGPTGSSVQSSLASKETTNPTGPTGTMETPKVPEAPKQTETVLNNDLNHEHNKVTAIPDPDYLITKNRRTILYSLKQKFERAKERNKNFNLKGSNCDKYSTALYDDMDNKPTDWPSPDEYYVGPSKGSKKNYIDYYKNQTKKSPEDGISSVFMDYGDFIGQPHMVTIFKDSDGTISSTEYTLVKGKRQVVNETYQNQQDFETAYGYSDFYYLSIEVVQ